MCRWSRRLAAVLLCAVIFGGAQARAQAPSGAASDAGRIEQRFTPETPPEAPAIPAISVPPQPAETAPANPGTFVLAGVDIEGATVFPAADFVPLYQPLLGHSTDLAGVQRIIEAITAKYRDSGYFLSRAEAPPQDLALGILHVRIVEGYIANVSFEGIAEDKQANLKAIAAPITEQRPAQLSTLERSLLLMQDTPGLSVTPRLQVVDAANGVFGLIVHADMKMIDASLHLDNRGTSLVGPLEQTAAVAINGLIEDNSRTRALVATTPAEPRELQYGEVSQDMALRADGTRLLLDASLGKVRSAGSISEPDLETRNLLLAAAVSHPLIRSNAQTLTVRAEIDSESAKELEPSYATYDDELRVIRVGASEQFSDGWAGLNIATVQVSQGLDILGASGPDDINVSRFGGRDDFTKLNVFASRHQTLFPGWAVQLAGQAQRSRTPLFLTEQFGVGGAVFGRAFDPSEITGDDGEAGSIELQGTREMIHPLLPWVQGFAFVDGGETSFQATGSSNSQHLASTGLGIRLRFARYFSGELLAAFPIVQEISNGNPRKGNSFFFSLNADY